MFTQNTVEKAVASIWHKGNTDGNCPIPEAVAKMREALNKTKGACNCELAVKIAIRKYSTVDDIIRVGSWRDENGHTATPVMSDRVIYHRNQKLGAYGRNRIKQDKRRVTLEESVYGKYLKSKGLWGRIKDFNLEKHNPTEILTEGCYWNERRALNMLMFMSKLKMDRITQFMPAVVDQWTKRLNLNVSGDNGDARKESKRGILKAEFEALNQAPEEVLRQIESAYFEGSSCVPHTFAGAFWSTWCNSGQGEYYNELGRMTMEALEYMGIGLYHNVKDKYTQLPSKIKKGAIPLAKRIISIQNTFNSMLKQGFDPSIVREEISSQLTEFAKQRCYIEWEFFSRLDAPMEYEIAKKKKASSPKASGGAKAQEPRIEVINGMELRF